MDNNAASFVGNIPQHYDQAMGPVIFADYAADLARRVARLKPARVLETAAGTGIVTRQLRDVLPAGTRLTSTDLNPPMLDIARAKFRPGEQVDLQPADAMALPFPDAGFDAVVCQFGVMFYPDKDKAYREAHRILVPGGRYLFSIWDAHRYNPFARIAHEVVTSFFPVDPPQFMNVPFSYSFEPIKASLIAAGFGDFDASVIRLQKEFPSAANFARGFVFGSPVIDQVRTRGGVDPEKIVETLTQKFHQEFGADPGHMPLQAIVFSAKKPS